MKWSEFKAEVDRQLAENEEIEDNDPDIWYIDISWPIGDELTIEVTEELGIKIS